MKHTKKEKKKKNSTQTKKARNPWDNTNLSSREMKNIAKDTSEKLKTSETQKKNTKKKKLTATNHTQKETKTRHKIH